MQCGHVRREFNLIEIQRSRFLVCPASRNVLKKETVIRREYPEAPIVAVGAVVIDEDRVLLVRRGQEPLKGEWSLPGGVLELGESLEDGVRREVLEETGLMIEPLAVVEVLSSITREAEAVRYHYVIIDYLCRVESGALACASDVCDARWVAREDLKTAAGYTLTLATMVVIDKAFRIRSTLESPA